MSDYADEIPCDDDELGAQLTFFVMDLECSARRIRDMANHPAIARQRLRFAGAESPAAPSHDSMLAAAEVLEAVAVIVRRAPAVFR